MLMRATPDAMRGRIVGIEFTQVAGAPNLGNIEAGVVASLTSVRTSIVSGGAICVVGCILCAIALPKFLHYDSRNPHE
jgi:fucose permease